MHPAPPLDQTLAAYTAAVPEPERPADPEELSEIVSLHRATALRRSPGVPSVSHDALGAGRLLTVVTDDLPLLVRAVLGALASTGTRVVRVIHPILHVRRNSDGTLCSLAADRSEERTIAESWIAVEFVGGPEDVVTPVSEALAEAAAVADDRSALADRLGSAHADLMAAGSVEAAAFLDWVRDGHLTLVGSWRQTPTGGTDQLGVARVRIGLSDPHAASGGSSVVRGLTVRGDGASPVWSQHHPLLQVEVGATVFLGFLSASGHAADVVHTPVFSTITAHVLAELQASVESHTGQELVSILDRLPRPLLLIMPPDLLLRAVRDTVAVSIRPRVHIDIFDDKCPFVVRVLIPRDRFTTGRTEQIADVAGAELGARVLAVADQRPDSPLAIVSAFVTRPRMLDDAPRLRRRLDELFLSWPEKLARALPPELSDRQLTFDLNYQQNHTVADAIDDLRRLDALTDERPVTVRVSGPKHHGATGQLRIYSRTEITLSAIVPTVHSLGVTIADEHAYSVRRGGTQSSHLYVLTFQLPATAEQSPEGGDTLAGRLADAFLAIWRGHAEPDGLNGLMIKTPLTWREVAVIRAYLRYARQLGTPHPPASLERIVLDNSGLAATLVNLFNARFDPALSDDARAQRSQDAADRARHQLERITSLDDDRVLRGLLTMITATRRTNALRAGDPDMAPVWSFKIAPAEVSDVPEPVPAYEIWVYSPVLEGVHLRFGAIARGGLRWSDRPDDFRTEILGLVKAQEVKNAVIVPAGAKGGFVVKKPPRRTGDPISDRAAQLAAGQNCYRRFVSALLDVVDDRRGGRSVTPTDIVAYDQDDSYLVVAADKGTATFSDLANEVAVERQFWLGDAFASGGSAGYDHKAMGITARGAWESVRYHFAELGLDVQADDFTAVGIGDMSGDVFGNGMLLSSHLRLVAAFDHRHIFVDPEPDAVIGLAERRRLFDQPGSSWDLYDRNLISAGGGVWSRSAKSIPITAAMRASLGLPEDRSALTPPELIKAVLTAPVDLLWNGGVGTYVKASTESDAQVGDKANDAVRVDAGDLHARVVGEGGNLGFTQRARIEYAQLGGRIRTDAVDNSAGVDTSDHEVNIKIAVQRAIEQGLLSAVERDPLLASLTDEIAGQVLADNVAQNRVIAVTEAEAALELPTHARLITALERSGRLRRRLEMLPDQAELRSRERQGQGLTSPEISVLLAYVKSQLSAAVHDSDLPRLELVREQAVRYFPTELGRRLPGAIETHPLLDRISATTVANAVINHAGLTYVFRAVEETGSSLADTVRAYLVATEVFALPKQWEVIWDPSSQIALPARHALQLASRRLLDRAVRWLLTRRPQPLDVPAELRRYQAPIAGLLPKLRSYIRPLDEAQNAAHAAEMIKLGAPGELAMHVASSLDAFAFLDIVDLADAAGRPVDVVADLYYEISGQLRFVPLLTAISQLPRDSQWRSRARRALRDDVHRSMRAITAASLEVIATDDPEQTFDSWRQHHLDRVQLVARTHEEIFGSGAESDITALSVLTTELRSLAS